MHRPGSNYHERLIGSPRIDKPPGSRARPAVLPGPQCEEQDSRPGAFVRCARLSGPVARSARPWPDRATEYPDDVVPTLRRDTMMRRLVPCFVLAIASLLPSTVVRAEPAP